MEEIKTMAKEVKVVEEETGMTKVKRWLLEHKEIIFAAGAFVLGRVLKGISDRKKIEFADSQAQEYYNEYLKAYDRGQSDAAYDIYKECVEHTNSVLIPEINEKYKDVNFSEDPEAMEQYYHEIKNNFNETFENTVCKRAGLPITPLLETVDRDTGVKDVTTL